MKDYTLDTIEKTLINPVWTKCNPCDDLGLSVWRLLGSRVYVSVAEVLSPLIEISIRESEEHER